MIALFGGTGFIGRHICQELHARNFAAVTISNNPDTAFLETFAPSIRGVKVGTQDAIDLTAQATSIIYLAHQSRPSTNVSNLKKELATNISTAADLFEQIVTVNPQCRLIYTSSGGQIYGRDYDHPIKESDLTYPTTLYGLGKTVIEDLLTFYATSRNARTTTFRLGNPIGRWQLNTSHGLVSATVRAAMTNQELTIFGAGDNQRDYFDVDDLAKFLVEYATDENAIGGTYNIGSGIGLTEKEIVAAVESATGRTIKINFAAKRSFDLDYAVLDIGKAKTALNWSPQTDLETSIKKIAAGLTQ